MMVRFVGLDRAAQAKGIFTVPFANAPSISPDSLEYVALAYGLGILRGNGSYFRPADPVSCAEAAVALVRTLTAAR